MFASLNLRRFLERRPTPRKRWTTPLSFELLEDRTVPASISNIYTVTSIADDGDHTLRDALRSGLGIIDFQIPGGGVHTITLDSPLTIDHAVTIDGFSENVFQGVGPTGVLSIRLQGAPSVTNGLIITASGSTIQGLEIVGFNSTSTSAGIVLQGPQATNNTIVGNDIGNTSDDLRTVAHSFAIPFAFAGNGNGAPPPADSIGIYLSNGATGNTIGGTMAGFANVISGNSVAGILVSGSDGNTIQDNDIGTRSDGVTALGNAGYGIRILNSNSTTIKNNVIAYSGSAGIDVASGNSNSIQSNSIHDNGALGIELDGSANRTAAPPVITQVDLVNGIVRGTVVGAVGTIVHLQFFASAADPAGNSEGQTLIGQFNTPIIGDSGSVSFTASISSVPSGEPLVTATATDSLGDTSQFSNAYTTGLTATDDAVNVSLGTTIPPINVLANDFDPGNLAHIVKMKNTTVMPNSHVTGSTGGTFTLNADNTISFDPGADFNNLNINQSRTTSITYVIDDGGAEATATLRVTVTPTDHAPTVAHQTLAQISTVGQTGISLSAAAAFDDVDVDFRSGYDQLTYTDTAIGSAVDTLPAGLQLDASTGVITAKTGTLTTAPGTYQITITATDNAGKAVSETFTWVVLPALVTASTFQDITVPGAPTSLLAGFNGNGNGNGLSITGILVNGAPQSDLTFTDAKGGVFTLNANGNYSFAPGTAYDYLFVNDLTTSSITYVVANQAGNTTTATLAITIHGIDDAPTVVDAIPQPLVNRDGDTVNLAVAGVFGDVDEGDSLTYHDTNNTLPPGLSLNTATGVITGSITANDDQQSPYSVTITATDSANPALSISSTFSWVVVAPLATNPQTSIAINVFTPQPASQAVVAKLNNTLVTTGSHVAGSSGGTFTLNADNTITFNPGPDFNDLNIAQSRTTSISYVLDDGGGVETTSNLVVTVTPTDHAPTVAHQTLAQISTVGQTGISLNAGAAFDDVDVDFRSGYDQLTFTDTAIGSAVDTLPAGLQLDASTGVITAKTGTLTTAPGTYQITITATDNAGKAVSETFTWVVSPATRHRLDFPGHHGS